MTKISNLHTFNLDITCGGVGLVQINDKLLNIEKTGTGPKPIVFVHGLGGTSEFFRPLIAAADLTTSYTSYLMDIEGHGLSPTKASSVVTIDSYATDLAGLFAYNEFNITSGVLVAHSMGCLVAMAFAIKHPSLVSKLILIGPPPSPLPAAAQQAQNKRAAAVRAGGMRASGVADAVSNAGTSKKTKASRPIAMAAVRGSLLSQEPEGYAKGCMALGQSADTTLDITKLSMPTLIITGDEDMVSPVKLVTAMKGKMKDVKVEVLEGCGHWHIYEDVQGVSHAVKAFLEV